METEIIYLGDKKTMQWIQFEKTYNGFLLSGWFNFLKIEDWDRLRAFLKDVLQVEQDSELSEALRNAERIDYESRLEFFKNDDDGYKIFPFFMENGKEWKPEK